MINKEKWIPIPNTIVKSNLKDYTKLVYAYLELVLVFYFTKGDKIIPSNYKISKTLNLKFETVKKAIQELTESGLLQNNQLYYFNKDNQLDNSMFNDTELFKVGANVSKEIGGFTEFPFEILSSKDLSSGERMSWIRIKSVKLDRIHFNGIATKTCISINTFKRHVKSLKEKGYLKYIVKRNSDKIEDTEILDLELFQAPTFKYPKDDENVKACEEKQFKQKDTIKAQVADAIKAEEIKMELNDNEIITKELETLNSERKNLVIKMNNEPNKASIYYSKIIEIDEKIAKIKKQMDN